MARPKRFYIAITIAITVSLVAVALGFWRFSLIQPGPGPVEIEVTAEKPFYLQGETVNFSIYVNNPREWPVEHPWVVDFEITNSSQSLGGVNVNIDFGPKIPTFPSHTRAYYRTWWWDQTMYVNETAPFVQVSPGFYTLTVSFGGKVEYGSGGNCTIEIRPHP